MSTPIAAIVTASSSRSSVRLNAYVSNEKKGQAKGERFVAQSGVNGCLPPFEERQFRDNRKHWGKNGERVVERRGKRCREGRYVQAYHVIESFARDGVGAFNPENPDDWERAHGIGETLAKKIAGPHRMATVTTQIDGQSGCIHNHIVIDSIDKTTGRSFDSSNVQHSRLAAAHDELLASLGYRQVNKLDKGLRSLEKGELREEGRHAQWQAAYDNGESATGDEPYSTAVLRRRIEDTLADTSVTSFDTFIDAARVHGVDVRERGSKGGITYTMLRRSGNG